jgi:hypothetical protein
MRILVRSVVSALCTLAGCLALGASAVPALAAAPEAPETGGASSITATSAILGGVLNPKAPGEAGVYYFVYAPRGAACTAYGFTAEAITPGFEKETVTPLEAGGLEPSTLYTYCLVDRSEETGETTVGSSKTFTTLATPPTVEGEASSGVNSTVATMEAQVNPNNQVTSCVVQYGKTIAYGTNVACEPASLEGFGNQRVALPVTGLEAGTTYHFRMVAENAAHEKTEGADQSFTTVPVPTTDTPSPVAASTATLKGHLTLDAVDTQYSFEYNAGGECTGGTTTTAEDAGTGSASTPVHTAITGLIPHTQYTVCMVASNVFGSETAPGVAFETPPGPPALESESEFVTEVAAASATLHANLDPAGAETTYHFQYVTQAQFEEDGYAKAQSTPESASIGADNSHHPALAHIQGLMAATTYHYRVAATNSVETVDGPDLTFTTQVPGGVFTLPDNRRWELVSPPNKHGATIYPAGEMGVLQAAAAGDAITYLANAPTELEPRGFSNEVQVYSARSAGGWSSRDIAMQHDQVTGASVGGGFEYRFFSPDLSLALVEPQGRFTRLVGEETAPEATERTVYLRHDATCPTTPATCYTPLVTAANVPPGTEFGGNPETLRSPVKFVGATPDLSHVIVNSEEGAALTSTPGDKGGLVEWTGANLQLISILPASEGGTPVHSAYLGDEYPGGKSRHAISDDGTRIFWTDRQNPELSLYMRDTTKGETLRIGGTNKVLFETASDDGSRVFFVEANEGEGTANLDVCDVTEVAGKLACKTTLLAPKLADGAQSGGSPGASADGSYVYFVSTAALTSKAVSGGDNLYVDHNSGAAWEAPTLIATLSQEDKSDWAQELNRMTARVSPNGDWLAFMSKNRLTGYDNRDANSGEPDEEVYLYNVSHDRLVCASCNPTGSRPVGIQMGELGFIYEPGILGGGDGTWPKTTWLAANIPGWTPYAKNFALYQPRYLSDNGRLFFNSGDALAPQDINGTWDVYEYEPPAVGGCSSHLATFSERSGGCVSLISSGASTSQSAFIDASATGGIDAKGGEGGGDVFFLTASQLTSQDFGGSFDIYDARECTNQAPCANLSVTPPPCSTGDSCKAAPSPQPAIFGSPSSATFAGAGNVVSQGFKPSVAPRSLTRAQKLAKALAACRKGPRKKRAACKRRARRHYRATQSWRKTKATKRGHR